MLLGPDLNSYKTGFDFGLATSQGCSVMYAKLGGNNLPGNKPHVSGSYPGFIDQARAAGWRCGHYWLTGGNDLAGSARFYLDNLRNPEPDDFYVLDNEQLDAGCQWSDAESAIWFETITADPRVNPDHLFLYGSKNNDLGIHPWPLTLALGVNVISANYNGRPLVNHVPGTIPADRVKGHQYADNGPFGGLSVDMNAFTDDAFVTTSAAGLSATPIPEEEIDMWYIQCAKRGEWLVGPGYKHHLTLDEAGQTKDRYTTKNAFIDFGVNELAFEAFVSAHTVSTDK